jgi:hypothetical protein
MNAAKFAKKHEAKFVSVTNLSTTLLHSLSMAREDSQQFPPKAVAAIMKEAETQRVDWERGYEIAQAIEREAVLKRLAEARKADTAFKKRLDQYAGDINRDAEEQQWEQRHRAEIQRQKEHQRKLQEQEEELDKLLDGPPPALPPTQEASSAAAAALQQEFDEAVQTLLEITTKPAAKLAGTRHSATDLTLVVRFLCQVAGHPMPPELSSDELLEALAGLSEGLS